MAIHQINIGGGTYTLAPQNVKPTSTAVSARRPIPFLSGLGATNGLTERTIYTDSENSFHYNPSTNVLTVPTVSGTLDGNATSATYIKVSGKLQANATYYVTFVDTIIGNRSLHGDSNLIYNPSTNVLTTGQVTAQLNGPVQTTNTSTSASYYISFVNASTTGMRYSYVDSNLYYNPSTNTLTTTTFSGSLSGTATNATNATNITVTGTSSDTWCPLIGIGSAITAGTSTHHSLYTLTDVNFASFNAKYGYIKAIQMRASEGFFETSDERLKDIVKPISVDLDQLSNLRKVYFNWKDKPESAQQLGMIAQEVQKYYPELVNVDETGYLTMNYDKLSVVALKAIDVLHEEVTELKKENAELKERLARLEELILNR